MSYEIEILRVGEQIDSLKQDAMARRLRFLEHHKIDVIFDVGANEGQYALDLRKHGWKGLIYSFEPVQSAYEALCVNAASDDQWKTSPLALGNKNKTQTIHVSGDSRASSLLPILPTHLQVADYFQTVATQEVTVRRLDDVIDELIPKNARLFLKIDAQGYEKKILRGAKKTLRRAIGVQLELSLTALYEGEVSMEKMLKYMRKRDFALCSLEYGFTDPKTGQMLQVDGIFGRRG